MLYQSINLHFAEPIAGHRAVPPAQIRMMLVGIEPSFTGSDLRTFECPKCKLDYKALPEDPMKSDKAVGSRAY
jgi:hypothetical protein